MRFTDTGRLPTKRPAAKIGGWYIKIGRTFAGGTDKEYDYLMMG